MDDRDPVTGDDDRVGQEAARWVLRIDRGLDAREQDEFSEWLARDPRHGEQLARYRSEWQRLDRLGQWKPHHSTVPNPDLLAPPRRRPWGRVVAFSLAVAGVAAALTVVAVLRRAPANGAEAIASVEVTQRMLEDGSTVDLNRDAVLTVKFTPSERRVRLERGEAFFKVAKDAARPFVVTVSDLEVRAVGTAFNVRRNAATVNVLVTEGHVRLQSTRADAGQPGAAEALAGEPLLAPNQLAVVSLLPSAQPLQVATLTAVEVDDVLAWQHRLLDFTAVPLEKVVAEFNRHNTIQLLVTDPELAAMPISATFRSNNVEGLVRLVEKGLEAQVERRGTVIVLQRRH